MILIVNAHSELLLLYERKNYKEESTAGWGYTVVLYDTNRMLLRIMFAVHMARDVMTCYETLRLVQIQSGI